jgi:hypothetical protein
MTATDTSWHPQNYYIQPHYRTMPEYLRIEDTFAPTLGLKKGRLWRRARNVAVLRWAPAVEFRVRERQTGYRNQRITLATEDIQPGIGGWTAFEVDPEPPHDGIDYAPGMAWVHVDLETVSGAFAGNVTGPLAYVMTHELGHALGFGHGGTGVMAVPQMETSPSTEELELARDYWGT